MINHDYKVPFTWGLETIDKVLTKPDFKNLIVLCGYPSTGKTEFTYFMARKNADLGIKVLYLSLEMPKTELAIRYAVKSAGVDYYDYQEKKYNEFQRSIIDQKYKEFVEYKNIEVYGEERTYTLKEVMAFLEEFWDKGCRMFIIDNLGKIGGFENEMVAQEKITAELQRWKNKTGACVFLLHHMAKPDKKKSYQPGGVEGIRGNQKIIDNATHVVEIFRDLDPYNNDMELRAKVQLLQYKNTMAGTTGEAAIYFHNGVYVPEYLGPKKKTREEQRSEKKKEIPVFGKHTADYRPRALDDDDEMF